MTQRPNLTAAEAARLLRNLGIEHLDDEEVVSCATGNLAGADKLRVDAHVSTCASCRNEVEQTRQTLRTFDTQHGHERLDQLWASFLGAIRGERVDTGLRCLKGAPTMPVPQIGVPVAAAGKAVATGASADCQLEWQFNELTNGDLEGIFSSTSPEYASAELALSTQPVRRVVLTKVFGKAWMGRFVIPRDEWTRQTGQVIDRVTFADGVVLTSDEGGIQ